jgi:hypothetical protein
MLVDDSHYYTPNNRKMYTKVDTNVYKSRHLAHYSSIIFEIF